MRGKIYFFLTLHVSLSVFRHLALLLVPESLLELKKALSVFRHCLSVCRHSKKFIFGQHENGDGMVYYVGDGNVR
jgi:hypothetical protein